MVGFDAYDRKARLYPGLLAVSSIVFLVVTLGWRQYPPVAVAVGVGVTCGGGYLLALLVRDAGRRFERSLWQSWGGPPTLLLLRTRTPGVNAVERDARRGAVQDLSGITLLSADEEEDDPAQADTVIEAAVRQVTRLGQSAAHPLVRAENINYGFERNFFAIRWFARILTMVCIGVLLAGLFVAPGQFAGVKVARDSIGVGIALEVIVLAIWILAPSRRRLRDAADRYADQLLRAAVSESRAGSGGNLP
jgi:hypothetical protein